MKSNNVPREDRIRRRIENLELKLYSLRPIRYGKGNPYSYCVSCKRSVIEASYAGHYKGCRYAGIENEIKHYRSLLETEVAN